MKRRSEIWLSALKECGAQCSVDTQRDVETMTKRVREEGDSFFLSTLPKFGKDLELALSLQRITPELFQGFKRRKLVVDVFNEDGSLCLYDLKFSGGAPQFLGGFLDLLFNSTLEMKESELAFAQDRTPSVLTPSLRQEGAGWVLRQADAVAAIRQLTLMFGKEKERCAPDLTKAAYDAFIETDRDLDSPLWTGGPNTSSEVDGSPT